MNDNLRWHAKQSQRITRRILVEGDLVLQTPTTLGGGGRSDMTDVPLLVDLSDGKTPLLTGASLAGALRSYLRTRQLGYLAKEPNYYEGRQERHRAQKREWATMAQILFGGEYAESESAGERVTLLDRSAVIVDDALGQIVSSGHEYRSGVKINPTTRTAANDKLFERQLWLAGTIFPLRLELVIRRTDDEMQLKQGLATALAALAQGEIFLGGRKRRGYGQVRVHNWRVREFDLQTPAGLLAWLEEGEKPLGEQRDVTTTPDIHQALMAPVWDKDERVSFHLKATVALDGSLLIRATDSLGEQVADFVHLSARQPDGSFAPVLSGTSLAGALRARAYKIANTLGGSQKARTLVYGLFGPDMDDGEWAKTQGQGKKVKPQASRLFVAETVIQEGVVDLVQNRVSIDRFTGGARDTALFNEQPVWGKSETRITIDLRVLNPKEADIGLLLLLLKDLWTGDLPLGGEISVGRGRLRGRKATLTLGETIWEIEDDGGRLRFSGNGNQAELQDKYLVAFLKEMGHES